MYMLFGSSRHVHVGVSAPISLMVAVTIRDVGAESVERRVALSLTITALTSVMYLLMMILRLDLIANFVPDPMVSGFCTAMALQIMSTNLKYVVGVPVNTDTVIAALVDLVRKIPKAKPAAVAVFFASCGLLVSIKSLNQRNLLPVSLPEQLVLLIAATWLSRLLDLQHRFGPHPPHRLTRCLATEHARLLT